MKKRFSWQSSRQLKEAIETPGAQMPVRPAVLKEFACEVKSVSDEARTVEFTITTGAVDRDNDMINPAGWRMDSYLKNPVVLWAHDYSQPPIGRCTGIRMNGNGLMATCEFMSKDMNPFAEQVYQMVKGGFLSATSVGFKPVKYLYNEERRGIDFEEQELLEFSVVPVPANAEALIESRGLEAFDGIVGWAEKVMAMADKSASNGGSGTAKAGRMLSKKNEKMLRCAHEAADTCVKHVKSILDQIDDPDEPDEPTPDTDPGADDTGKALSTDIVFTLVEEDEDEKTFTLVSEDEPVFVLDADDLKNYVATNIQAALSDLVGREITAAVNAARGRID